MRNAQTRDRLSNAIEIDTHGYWLLAMRIVSCHGSAMAVLAPPCSFRPFAVSITAVYRFIQYRPVSWRNLGLRKSGFRNVKASLRSRESRRLGWKSVLFLKKSFLNLRFMTFCCLTRPTGEAFPSLQACKVETALVPYSIQPRLKARTW